MYIIYKIHKLQLSKQKKGESIMVRFSLKKKLFILLSLISIIPTLVISTILYKQSRQSFEQTIDSKLEQAIKVSNFYFNEKQKVALSIAHKYAQQKNLISAFKKKDRNLLDQKLKPIFKLLKEDKGLTVFEFGDEKGVVFTRAHHPGKFGDDKSDNNSIDLALQGEEVKGFEFGKSGLAVRAFVPIKDNHQIIGTLQVGFNLNNQLLKNINNLISGDVAFYEKDKLIQSSRDLEQERLGTTIEDKSIFDRVSLGERVTSMADNNKLELYLPLSDPSGQKIRGMLRISQDLTCIRGLEHKFFTTSIFSSLAIFTLVILISLLFSNKITKPILAATNFANEISSGNLNIELLGIKTQDELNILATALNKMYCNLKGTIINIRKTSKDLFAHSQELLSSAQRANRTITGNQRLMDNITLIIEGISESMGEMATFAQQSSNKTQLGNDNIKDTLKSINQISVVTKGTVEIIEDLHNDYQEINQIVELITNITKQTNLLALNANIEANNSNNTRNGFKVIADEIRTLSIETNNATENILTLIQQIEQKSNEALTAIREVAIKTETSQEIAQETGSLFTEIKSSSQESSMQIQQTASATDDWEAYNKEIFNSYQNIEIMSQELNASSQELKEISHSLMDMVDEFKI